MRLFLLNKSKSFKNKDNLSLKECYERFGTKIVMANNFYYKVVFLDETKDLGYSWMLWSKDIAKDTNMRVTLYEKDPSVTKVVGDI